MRAVALAVALSIALPSIALPSIALPSIALPSIAEAQSPQSRARRLFDQGRAALGAAQFGRARDLFVRSLELHPNPGTAFNLGTALRRSGELSAAHETLTVLLAGRYGRLSPDQIDEVGAIQRAIVEELATLSLDVRAPEDAEVEVRLDGERVASTAVLRLDPGDHVITATCQRFRSVERRIRLGVGDDQSVVLEMLPLPESLVGRLILEATNPSHWVAIEGVGEAQARLERELTAGAYVAIVRDGARRRSRAVEVLGGETMRLSLDFQVGSRAWRRAGIILAVAAVVGTSLTLGLALGGGNDPIRDDVFGVVTAVGSGRNPM